MIGLIIHGPEVVDNGNVSTLLTALECKGPVDAIMAGTTGVCALIDNGLHERVTLFTHHRVSDAVMDLSTRCDLIIIQNESKTLDGSTCFMSVINERIQDAPVSVVYVDNYRVSSLIGEPNGYSQLLSDLFSVPISEPPSPQENDGIRTVHGALPGENIWIDGNVIGKVTSIPPRIWFDENGIPVFEGIETREHGLQHVGSFDLFTAKIRSGITRRTDSSPKSIEYQKADKAILVDHDTEEGIRNAHDSQYAISIGDDTTRNTSSILYRFSVPVIGVVDGDEDGICREDIAFPGSVKLQVRSGQDDIIGESIRTSLFNGSHLLDRPPSFEEALDKVRELIGDRLLKETKY